MTPEQEIARRKQLVSGARALLSLQVGFGLGCIRMNRLLHRLGQDHQSKFPVFGEFLKATSNYPITQERLRWAYEPLLKLDVKLVLVESKFRPRILQSCIEIIETYDQRDESNDQDMRKKSADLISGIPDGNRAIRQGRLITHEQVGQRLARWLKQEK